MLAASEREFPVQPSGEERIATTTNERARLSDLGNGSSLLDPFTLKDLLRERDAITSWPPNFLSDITVFAWKITVTKNCSVTCVTWKIREYANFVSNLLAYVISVVSP